MPLKPPVPTKSPVWVYQINRVYAKENGILVQAGIFHIWWALLEWVVSGGLQTLCEPPEIICKILYLHVGILARVFSSHQIFKKVLEPNYLRITVSWFAKQLCFIILFDLYNNAMRKTLQWSLIYRRKCEIEKDDTGIKFKNLVFWLQTCVLPICSVCVCACRKRNNREVLSGFYMTD